MPQSTGELSATRNMIPYYAPYDPANDLPLDTIAYGTDWATPWINAGYSTAGMGFTIDRTVENLHVDQVLDAVLRPISAREIHFDTKLAQISPTLLQVASGMGALDTVAAITGTRGHDDYTLPTAPPTDVFYSFGFDLEQSNGEAFRALIYKGIPTASPNPTFGDPTTLADYDFIMSAVPGDSGTTHPLALFRRVTPAL